MVSFGASTSVFDATLPAATPIVNPVQDNSGEAFASGLASGLKGFANSLEYNAAGRAKAAADAAEGAVIQPLVEYLMGQKDFADQTGSYDEARRNSMVALNSYIANNPTMADAILSAATKVTNLVGNPLEESPVVKANKALMEEAAKSGITIETLLMTKHNKAEQERLQSETDLARARGEALTAGNQAELVAHFNNTMYTHNATIYDKLQTYKNDILNGTKTREAVISEVQGLYGQFEANIKNLAFATGKQEGIDVRLAPGKRMVEDFVKWASGELDATILENSLKNEKNTAKLNIMQNDPEVVQLAAWQEMFPNSTPLEMDEMRIVLDRTKGLFGDPKPNDVTGGFDGEPPPNFTGNSEETRTTISRLVTSFDSMTDLTKLTPEQIKNGNNMVTNIIRGVVDYGPTVRNDPRKFNEVARLLSSVSFGRYIEAHPEAIQQGNLSDDAISVVNQHYTEVALKAIDAEYANLRTTANAALNNLTATDLAALGMDATSTLGSTSMNPDAAAPVTSTGVDKIDVSQVIKPTWNGAGVQFVITDPKWKNNASIREVITKLNSSEGVAGVMNNLVRMTAHLSGTTDYARVYKDAYEVKLLESGAAVEPTGQATLPADANVRGLVDMNNIEEPANLTVEDFKSFKETTGIDLEDFITGGSEEPIAKPEAAVPKTEGNKEGLFAYLVKGRPDSYVEDLNPDFAGSLSAMLNDMPDELKGTVLINSGARSYQRQAALWQEALVKYGSPAAARKWVAPPGKSMHNHGIAADLSYASPAALKWVHDNAKNYGLHFPLGNENWHIEPLGSRG